MQTHTFVLIIILLLGVIYLMSMIGVVSSESKTYNDAIKTQDAINAELEKQLATVKVKYSI